MDLLSLFGEDHPGQRLFRDGLPPYHAARRGRIRRFASRTATSAVTRVRLFEDAPAVPDLWDSNERVYQSALFISVLDFSIPSRPRGGIFILAIQHT